MNTLASNDLASHALAYGFEPSGSAMPEGLRASPELAAVFAGADVGLALFDTETSLVACNAMYRTLCGYRAEDTVPGTRLGHLIQLSLERQNLPTHEIEETVARALDRLEPGSAYTFRYTSPSARLVDVRRARLVTGTVVETVREVSQAVQGADLNAQFATIAEAARARMMHALDVMADGFALYDAHDRLVVYNRKYIELNLLIADAILPGSSFEGMLRLSVERGAVVLNGMPADEYVALRLAQHHNPGEPYECQMTDGRWVLINEKRTPDGGIVGIRSDITEMKHREFDLLRISQQLHAKNSQFDSALNNMVQGLCMFDKEQNLIVCNKRYVDLYGFSGDVVKPGITLRDIMEYSVSLGNYTVEEAERALAERYDPTRLRQRVTLKQRLKDGRVIAVMNEPMPGGGTIATYQDITDLERHEQRTQDYMVKLERSNRELQDFAYVASHDLQEPLRKIEAFGDRLKTRYGAQLPADGQMFIERMQNAAERMRRLINDLLTYSRVATKGNPFAKVSLNEVLVGVLSDLQIRIDETKAEITAGPIPEIVADPTQMRQLLQNLLSNALKFRKADVTPVIRIDGRMETVQGSELEGPSDWLVLTVADNGIGFDNQYKDQIFKIFQRLHGRLEYEGTGVGLATCRKIAERHQGEIDADGRPGEGATFIVRLPCIQATPK